RLQPRQDPAEGAHRHPGARGALGVGVDGELGSDRWRLRRHHPDRPAPRARGARTGRRRPHRVGMQGSTGVFDAIRTLLAVRSYQSTPVPDALVRRIVEAGRLTGSGMNGQPWHFIVVRDAGTLRKLGALASSGPYVAQAPLAIVVATAKSRF